MIIHKISNPHSTNKHRVDTQLLLFAVVSALLPYAVAAALLLIGPSIQA